MAASSEAGSNTEARLHGRRVRSSYLARLLTYLMVMGPGLIVMEADNDAGAAATYTQAGGQYGPHLLWVLLILLPVTYFVQEMAVRLGIATGKGHAAMIDICASAPGGVCSRCAICTSSTF
jgi:Mn2+/Fe2+ NRAMP family transporter